MVSNLYPFRSDPSVEQIDIGGPAMVRAAAKNHERVGVVVQPDDYPAVLEELEADGALSDALPGGGWPERHTPTPAPTTRPSPIG